jgi:hypothetical protein
VSPLSGGGLFSLAAALGVFAVVAVWQAIDSVRWGEARRFWMALAVRVPLAAAACGAAWLGVQNPYANFWNNAGFGPDWECGSFGSYAIQVCSRDLPLRLQPEPPKPAATLAK